MTEITLSDRQIATLKNTIAKKCDSSEFNLFVEYCKNIGLDPIRKQVIPIVFSANDASKRQLTIVVTIDGLRAIAERVQNYRPDEDEPRYSYDKDIKSPSNPLGIEKCTVRVWKQDRKGEWYPVNGTAYWDEFAPTKKEAEGGYDWEDTDQTWPDGRPKKRKVPRGKEVEVLDRSTLWPKMPRIMIAKCAEAQALRKGWPDQFSGVHTDAEFDHVRSDDVTATEIAEQYAEDQRLKMIGGERQITLLLDTDIGLERVPSGQVADRYLARAKECEDLNALQNLRATNKESLQEFWAYAPTDALGLKKELEILESRLSINSLPPETQQAIDNMKAG